MELIRLYYKYDQIDGNNLFGIAFPKGYNSAAARYVMFFVGHLVKDLSNKIIEPNTILKGKVVVEINTKNEIRQIAGEIAKYINRIQ